MSRTIIRRGPLLMILASAAFTAMMSFMKLARAELDTLDVVFWRGATAAPLALAMCWSVGLRVRRPGLIIIRALCGTTTVFLLGYSARGLAVADMTLLFRLQPILIALLAPIALGHTERAGRAIWLLLILSMVGVTLILAPSLAVGSRYGLAALAAGASSACAHVTVRALMRTDDPRIVVFYFHLLSIFFALICLYLYAGRLPVVPPAGLIGPVLGVGLCATMGQILLTFAYRADRAAVVAAATYAGVLFAVLVDILYFAIQPGVNVWLGGALIVCAGIWLIVVDRAPAAPATESDGSSGPESTNS